FHFTYTPPTEIYTLSLHDALPICECQLGRGMPASRQKLTVSSQVSWRQKCRLLRCQKSLSGSAPSANANREPSMAFGGRTSSQRSEEHTSELQSQSNLVCRLLLEK